MATIAHNIEDRPRTADVSSNINCNFDSFILSPTVSRGLHDAGFYKPSPIQLKAIPLGKCGLDLIVKSKSGTGKTLVFVTVALEMIDVDFKHLQVLIIAPTREIADQIVNVIEIVGKHIKGLKVGLFIGGLSYQDDVKRARMCHIAVGAPGRIKHLVETEHLQLKSVRLFVLDEADKLMSENFLGDIDYLYYMLPTEKQFLAFSATITDELSTFFEWYMRSPTFVSPEMDSSLLLGLRQFVSVVEEKSNVVQQFRIKLEELTRIFSQIPFTQCIVFSNYQQRTESISNILNQQGWHSLFITGAQSQYTRMQIMDKLKKLECKILLTTDLTARGIDASNVDLVINYDIPYDSALYLHRMGRSGRYGSSGICITIASRGKEVADLQHILGDIGGNELFIAQLPSGSISEDVWQCDLNIFEKIQGVVDTDRNIINWDMLYGTSTNNPKKKTKNNKTVIKQTQNFADNSQLNEENQNILKNIESLFKEKNSNNDLSVKYSDTSSENLLQSLAQGIIPKTSAKGLSSSTKSEESSMQFVGVSSESLLQSAAQGKWLVNPADLYPWILLEESVILKPTGPDLLNDSDESSVNSENESPLIEREIFNKKLLLARNIALYHICKILKSECWNFKIITEAIQPIDKYLNLIKEENDSILKNLQEFSVNIPTKKMLNEIGYYLQEFAPILRSSLTLNQEASKQNICKIAYDFITKGTADWRNLVSNNYKTKIKKSERNVEYRSFLDEEMEADVQEEEVEEEVRERKEIKQKKKNYYSYNFGGIDRQNLYPSPYAHFTEYYDYYEQMLSNTAPTFKDITSLRNWLKHWREQVRAVTNCLQEKIYIEEMNNYQYDYYYRHIHGQQF